MRKRFLLLLTAILFISLPSFAQEGTKQLMPNSNDRLWLEFNAFDGNNFGTYSATENERIHIYLNAGEKMHFGMKMYTDDNYGGNVLVNPDYVSFQIKNPSGGVIFGEQGMITSGNGYINTYTEAVTGPNGVILNGSTISGGYDALTYTAAVSGNYYIEFDVDNPYWPYRDRFALEFFDVTVTDAANNVITNPGEPNKSAGRLWSKGWSFTTTSFTEYPVNAHFHVYTSDEFINKVNFKMYPYSFAFVVNSYGVTTYTEENYIKRTQSLEGDQTSDEDITEYQVFLNDPDRSVWQNTTLVPPEVQVLSEDTLFMDYNYNRDPLYLPLDIERVVMEKNMPSCTYDDVAIFQIETNNDGFTAILIDVDGDGSYSTGGSDRVIYRDMKKGVNYVLWDFTTDGGAEVAVGDYNASATFFGRGPAHFPLYDVEQMDGIITSSVRPFNKLNTTIYWDDTEITRWGDQDGGGLMDETQQKQLVVENDVPRTWSWHGDIPNTAHNGNLNTLNTWFNAIDLGYSEIGIHVQESETKCVDGAAPWVGDIYKEGPKDTDIQFTFDDFDYKFFHPFDDPLSEIEVINLPANGTLKLNGTAITAGDVITAANLENITYTPESSTWHGETSFDWRASDGTKWSNNDEKVYIIINTPPVISSIPDQDLCTNTPTDAIEFTVTDAETAADDLELTAFSGDPEFVPNNGIVLGGSGTNRSVTVTPVANKSGKAIIYIMADDGYIPTIQQFTVYVGPDLEFSGDTTVCVGDPLYLIAQEVGASYSWKYEGTEISTDQSVQQDAGSVGIGEWTLTVDDGECVSTRTFNVSVSPLTTFTGDTDVCIGEEIYLSATEVNASVYRWERDGTLVSSEKQLSIPSASLTDASTNYTLYIEKDGCVSTSAPFAITVVEEPNAGLTVEKDTIDPGKTGNITIANAQTDVTYNIYDLEYSLITSGLGDGSDLNIPVTWDNLSVGDNEFLIGADNGNCEVELDDTALIHVNTPGVTVSDISGNTAEIGTQATFTVHLDTEPYENVVILITSDDETEGTVSPGTLTFTSSNYATAQTVTVTGEDDDIIDENIEYTIITETTSSDTLYHQIETADVSVINEDDDVAGVTVNPTTGLTTTEAGSTDNFTVVLNCQPAAEVTIDLSSSDITEGLVTAVSRGTVDPNNNTATITFDNTNWNNQVTVTVTGRDDDIDDDNKDYSINTSLTSSPGDSNFDGLLVDNVQISNSDDDNAGISVNPLTGLQTTEDGGTDSFEIVLESEPTASVTIALNSSDATEGAVSPSSVTFSDSNWETPVSVTVTGKNDNIDDDNVGYNIITGAASSSDTKYDGLNPENVAVTNVDNDQAAINVSQTSGLLTSEDGTTATLEIYLETEPVSDVELTILSNDVSEGKVSRATITFTPSDYSTPQSLIITGQDDPVIDGDVGYTVTVEATAGDPKYTSLSTINVSVTNEDNDYAGLNLSGTSLSTSETGTNDSFTVSLTAQPASDVNLEITGLDDTEGTLNTTSLAFTPSNWNTPQEVIVTGKDDAEQDGNVSYNLTIAYDSGDTDFSAVTETVSVENSDDDVAGVSVSPSSGQLSITEGGTAGEFTISLNTQPAAGETVTFSFSSPDENEITLSSETAVFTHDDWNPVLINVQAVDDQIDDSDQSYTIDLGSATSGDPNYNNMSAGNMTVNVTDIHTAGLTVSSPSGNTTEDGGTATYTVVLDTKPTADVTITSESQNTNEGDVTSGGVLTFTSSNWDDPQTVTVTGQDDDVDDGLQNYPVDIQVGGSDPVYSSSLDQSIQLSNEDNDEAGIILTDTTNIQTTEAGTTSDAFYIALNTEPTDIVTINFNSTAPDEATVIDSVKFTPSNWNTPREIIVTGVDDAVDDGDQPYTINISVSSVNDPLYDETLNETVTGINIDNDMAAVSVSETSGLVTTEAGGTATFDIILDTEPTDVVTIDFSSTKPHEGTVSPASITFDNTDWNTAQTITITGVDDYIDDGDSTYYVNVGVTSGSGDDNYDSTMDTQVEVTNTDDDDAGLILANNTNLETTEAGGNADFTIKLSSEPTDDVTIDLSSTKPHEGTVSPASITFDNTDWSTAQTITITGVDDFIDDGDSIYYVDIEVSSGSADLNYDVSMNTQVEVTNLDDDDAGINVTPTAGLYTEEDGTEKTFDVVLTSQPVDDVVITLYSNDESEGVIDKSSLTFTPANWNSPQTITITGKDDDVDDGDIAYKIITDPDNSTTDDNYRGFDPSDVSVTNKDDDTWGFTVNPHNLTFNEDGADDIFTIVLNSEPTDNVTIDLSSSNPSRATVSPTTIEFIPTEWNIEKSITVSPDDNAIDDGDANLDIYTATAVSLDGNYSGKNPVDVAVEVIDDDIAGITVSNISGNTAEDGTTATFTVVLDSEPTDNVTIDISSSNTDEGTVSPGQITFTSGTTGNWNSPQTITITGQDDAVSDGNQTYYIQFDPATSTDDNYSGLQPANIEVVNADDDSPGITVFPVSGLTTNEAGETADFSIKLNSEPANNVTIDIISSDESEGTISPIQIIFTSGATGNWNSPQTITITGQDDISNDGDQPYTIDMNATSSDTDYDEITVPTVQVTNMDDIGPRAEDDDVSTDEDTDLTIDVLANDNGLDDGNLTVTITSEPSYGEVVIETDNSITYSPNGLYNGNDVFTYEVCDGEDDCDEATVTVDVTFVNDIPVAVDDSRGTTINTPVIVDVLFNDYGLEDGGIAVGIETIPDPLQGTAVVNSDDSTITFTPATDFIGEATFIYNVTDTQGDKATATVTINVRENNHVPDAVNDIAQTEVNTPVDINVLANDSGLEDGFGAIDIHENAQHGTLSLNLNRTIKYEPETDYIGDDSFMYIIEDADGDYDTATVVVNVVDDQDTRPVATDDACATEYEISVNINVLSNDTVADGVGSVSISSSPGTGSCLVETDNTITYTPETGYSGKVTFKYQVCDVDGDCATATVTVTVKEDGVTNYIPVAENDNAETWENTPVDINVLANDTDLDDGFGSLSISGNALNGTLTINDNRTITYTPAQWFIGTDEFEYRVEDTDGDWDVANVIINVIEEPNHIPVAVDDSCGTEYQTMVTIDVLSNDSELQDGDIEVTVETAPASGTAVVQGDNTINFTPADGFDGPVTFSYRVTDGDGDTDVANVKVTVKEDGVTNYIPVAMNDVAETWENTPVDINVLENDRDLNDGFGSLTITNYPSNGTLTINDNRTITYTPAPWYVGPDEFEYKITDIDGDNDVATVTISVNEEPNHIPNAVLDIQATEYETLVNIDVLQNDSGLEDGGIEVTIDNAPLQGIATVLADNTIDYTPADGFSGEMSFNYKVTDIDGDSDVATVMITVKDEGVINYVPMAENDNAETWENTPVDITVLANDTGLDDGLDELTISGNASNGTLTINDNRTITYTPAQWFIGTDEFEYKISDVDGDNDVAIVTVNVTEEPNHIPVAVDDSCATEYQTMVTIDVLSNDSELQDGDIEVTVETAPASGTAVVQGDNTINFTPADGFDGPITFSYRVTDGDGDTDVANVKVTVKEDGVTNYVPVAADDHAETTENTPVDINVLANDTGLDDGFGALTITNYPSNGTLTINDNRTITYTPAAWYIGSDEFEYKITDIDGDNDVATVTLIVTEKPNHIPNAVYDSRGTEYETPVNIDVLDNDSGLEDGGIEVTIDNAPLQGTATVLADNTIDYSPASTFSGSVSFSYKVNDIDGDADVATVNVNVKEEGVTNYVPVAENDNAETFENTSVDINILANDTGLDDGFGELTISTDASNGIVTINENRTITYTPAAWFIGTDVFEYRIEDVDGDNDIATVTVTVTEEPNHLPIAVDDACGTEYQTLVNVDVLNNDSGLEDGGIVLSIENNPAEGTVNVQGDNTIDFIPAAGYSGLMTFDYRVADKDGDFDIATVSINVKEEGVTNYIPVAVNDTADTWMNNPVTVNVLANDSNLNDGFGEITIVENVSTGTLIINDNRTITYTPSQWFVGTEKFEYKIADVDGDYDIAEVTIHVTEEPNHRPDANDDRRGTEYETPVDIDVLINDDELQDTPIEISIESEPAQGDVIVNANNTITFTPALSYVGEMLFQYRVTDKDGDFDVANVYVTVKPEGVQNYIPVAEDDQAETLENIPVDINVLANDTIKDDFGKIELYTQPVNGTAAINPNRTITYTPAYSFIGKDSLSYWVEDEDGDYDIATVTIFVRLESSATPEAFDDNRATEYETRVNINVLANDRGLEDEGIVVTVIEGPLEGAVSVQSDNTIDFTPADGYTGFMTFDYRVADIDGDADTAKVTVHVKPEGVENDVPVAANDDAQTWEDIPVDINVLANDNGLTDGFGQLIIHEDPLNGTVVVNNNRTITYTPSTAYIGLDSLIYWVEDVDGDYDIAKVNISVTEEPNHIPVAMDDARGTEYETTVNLDVLANDAELQDGGIVVTIVENPAEGTAAVQANNTIDFTPAKGFSGSMSFDYRVADKDGDADTATVTINVKDEGVTNHIPAATSDNVETWENTPVDINVLVNDRGLEDGFGKLMLFKGPVNGSAIVNDNRTITYVPYNSYLGQDSLTYWIEDVDGDYDIAKVSITVTEEPNHVPLANDDARGTEYETTVNVDVLTNDTELQDGGIVVTIEENPTEGIAAVQADNTINFTPADGYSGVMPFDYRVTDKDGDTDVATVTITVKEEGVTNHIPVADDDNAETWENTPVEINVLANDNGLDDGFGQLIIKEQPLNGTVVVNDNRTITYTPSNAYIGLDSLIYWIEDVDGDYDIAKVRITVTEEPNHIPVAMDDARGTEYETTVNLDVLANDAELQDGGIVVTIVENPAEGTAAVQANNTIDFTPADGFSGLMTFDYRVADTDGDADTATVTINVKEEGQTNYIPDAIDDEIQTLINIPVDINVLANDRGLEDGFGQLTIDEEPSRGTVVINENRTITYTPSAWFTGVDEFTYRVEDIDGDYDIAKVSISVTEEPNHVPVAMDDARGTEYETTVNVDVLTNDTELQDGGIVVTIEENPTEGIAAVQADNTINFTPADGYSGVMPFDYRVTDKDGDTDVATVTITVKEEGVTNHIPVADDDNAETWENTPVDINVLANDFGLEDGFGKLILFEGPVNGSAIVNENRTITYTPANAYIGQDSLTYWVEDVDGDYDIAKVSITVTEEPNHVPVANDDARGTEYETTVNVNVLTNDDELQDGGIVVTIEGNPTEGVAAVEADNTINFTPADGFSGVMTFDYRVTDKDSDTDVATVSITVKEEGQTNYIPAATSDDVETWENTPVDINVLANDRGLEDGFGKLILFEGPVNGTAIVNENRTITYTPYNSYIGEDSLIYWIEDVDGDYDMAKVSITVTEEPNHIPVAMDDARGTEYETTVNVDVLTNDTELYDGGIVVAIEENPTEGIAAVQADNTIDFTPADGFSGVISFDYRVTDKDGDTDVATVTITVKEEGVENNVPVAVNDNAETFENTAVDINVLANDTGLDDGFGQLYVFTEPVNGTIVVNSNRTITYTPANAYIGSDSLTYWVEDIDGDYDMATVYITVSEKPNYIPVAKDDRRGASFNTPVTVDVLINDQGLDDGGIVVSLESMPQNGEGSALANADNTVTFTPQADYIGEASFTYRVTDIDGDYDTASVTINVKEGENIVPLAANDNLSTTVNKPVTANILANDNGLDDGIGEVLIFEAPEFGNVVVNDDYTITYTPSSYFIGQEEFKYMIEDVDGDYDIATVYITVLDYVNQKPVANDDARGTSLEAPVNVDVLFNDTGLSDGGIQIYVHADAEDGKATVNSDNTITYTPDNNFLGQDQFEYQVCDIDGDCDVATVTITVREENHVPEAVDDMFYTNKNARIDLDVLSNDTGLDDGGISVMIPDQLMIGNVSVNADNSISYTPLTGYEGTETFTYIVSDVDGDYDIGTVTIHVMTGTLPGVVTSDINNVTKENGETGSINLVLNTKPTDNVIINLSSTDISEGEVAISPIIFTPDNWNTEQTVVINGVDDDVQDGTIDYIIRIENAESDDVVYNGLSISNVHMTNEDDDEAGITVVADGRETSEDGDYVTMEFVLNSEPVSDVSINLVSDNMNEAVLDFFNILFTPDNWSDTIAVTVTGVDDDVVDGDVEYNIVVQSSESDDGNYHGINPDDFTLVNLDNDTKELKIPEAFSPGYDGFNDYFEIINLKHHDYAKLRVYNRWGSLVYSSDNYKNDWDGTSNVGVTMGAKLPTGTYFYILEVNDIGGKMKGSVFIKR